MKVISLHETPRSEWSDWYMVGSMGRWLGNITPAVREIRWLSYGAHENDGEWEVVFIDDTSVLYPHGSVAVRRGV